MSLYLDVWGASPADLVAPFRGFRGANNGTIQPAMSDIGKTLEQMRREPAGVRFADLMRV